MDTRHKKLPEYLITIINNVPVYFFILIQLFNLETFTSLSFVIREAIFQTSTKHKNE